MNLKKCHFLTNILVFLGYVILGDGIKMDLRKIEVILSWPVPKSLHEVRSLIDLLPFIGVLSKTSAALLPMLLNV